MKRFLTSAFLVVMLLFAAAVVGFYLTALVYPAPPGMDEYVPAFIGSMGATALAAAALAARAVLSLLKSLSGNRDQT